MSADIYLLRTAWRYANTGSTAPDADSDAGFDELVEAFKKRQRAIGHLEAQEAMQATIDGSAREVQAKAWDACADHATKVWGVPGASVEHMKKENPFW